MTNDKKYDRLFIKKIIAKARRIGYVKLHWLSSNRREFFNRSFAQHGYKLYWNVRARRFHYRYEP